MTGEAAPATSGRAGSGVVERRDAAAGDRVVALRAAAAGGGGFADARPDAALLREPFERRVDGADGDGASGARFDLLPDAHAVALVAEAPDREQDDLLELAEIGVTHRGEFYNLKEIKASQK
jgi:hypothetical protein